MDNNLKAYNLLPKGAFVPKHLDKWAVVTEYFIKFPAVAIELSASNEFAGEITYWYSDDELSLEEVNEMLLENYQNVVKSFKDMGLSDEAAGQEPELITELDGKKYPVRLDITFKTGETVCVFDENLHGWNVKECNYSPKTSRKKRTKICCKCEAKEFTVNIPWLSFQVFDEGWDNDGEKALQYRDSFDSISIDITCTACGCTQEGFLEAETA